MSELQKLEDKVRRHSRVSWLLANKTCGPAAEAAIAELIHGKKCSIKSWEKSSSWLQVEEVIKEIVG